MFSKTSKGIRYGTEGKGHGNPSLKMWHVKMAQRNSKASYNSSYNWNKNPKSRRTKSECSLSLYTAMTVKPTLHVLLTMHKGVHPTYFNRASSPTSEQDRGLHLPTFRSGGTTFMFQIIVLKILPLQYEKLRRH